MAKVDIVVPCYNYGRFLTGCVHSVLDQSLSDLRVLIIDDASCDDTSSVAQKLASSDRRVSFISHSENWGHIRTYNQGIAWASSKYFLLLSADDLLVAGALKRAADIMDANSDIVLTHGTGISWDDDLPFPRIELQNQFSWTSQKLVHEMCAIGANVVNTPTAIARTCVQQEIGCYKTSLPHSADMEMWLHFGARGRVARVNAVQAIYRRHSSNMSHQYWNEDWSDYPHRKAAFDHFFADHPTLPDYISLRLRADRALAKTAFWRGLSRLRRGHIGSGFQLCRFAIDLYPRSNPSFGWTKVKRFRAT